MANFEFLLKECGQQNNISCVTFIYQESEGLSFFKVFIVVKGPRKLTWNLKRTPWKKEKHL